MEREKKYRPNAAVFVTDGQGRILLCSRSDGTPFLQTVQGGIDEGETARQAAIREMSEELGLAPASFEIIAEAKERHRYHWTKSYIQSIIVKFGSHPDFDGQEQQYFLAQVAVDAQFVLDAHHQEFSDVRWGTPEELIEKSWPEKTEGFRRALQEFGLLNHDLLSQKNSSSV